MNAQDITSLAHKVSSFVAELDADDLRDDLLARAHLQRRRPVLRTFSSIGLVGFGAMAAFATVLFVPQVREFFVGKGNDADDAREKIGTKAREVADDLHDEIQDDIRAAQNKSPFNNRAQGRSS